MVSHVIVVVIGFSGVLSGKGDWLPLVRFTLLCPDRLPLGLRFFLDTGKVRISP